MKIQAKFYPDVDIKDLECGVISEISWQRLEPFLSQAFAISNNEQLVGITVTESGIKAKIRYTDVTVEYVAQQSIKEDGDEKKFSLEQIKRMCCWIFDGDYIHTLTNSHDVYIEIVRLVDIYSTYPQFYIEESILPEPPTQL